MTKYIDQFIAEYDTNGVPLVGGKLNFYEAGTTTPTPVYEDEALTTPLSNPVIANGDGRFPIMYMQKIKYKIVLTDSDDVVQATGDDLDYTNTTLFNDIKVYATTTESGVVILATTADVIAGTSTTKVVTPNSLQGALAELTVSPIDFINGLLPTNDTDTDHDLTVSIGQCRNATNDGDIELEATITKQTDEDWDTGTDAGGMPTSIIKTGTFTSSGTAVTGIGTAFDTEFSVGDVVWSNTANEGSVVYSVDSSTTITLRSAFASGDITPAEAVYKNGLVKNATYFMFVLSDSSGETVDAGYDTQLDAVNLLADTAVVADELVKYRMVGKFKTDSSANIIPFKYFGEGNLLTFKYDNTIIADTSKPTTATLIDTTLPTGSEDEVIGNVFLSETSDDVNVQLSSGYKAFDDIERGTQIKANDERQLLSLLGLFTNTDAQIWKKVSLANIDTVDIQISGARHRR